MRCNTSKGQTYKRCVHTVGEDTNNGKSETLAVVDRPCQWLNGRQDETIGRAKKPLPRFARKKHKQKNFRF